MRAPCFVPHDCTQLDASCDLAVLSLTSRLNRISSNCSNVAGRLSVQICLLVHFLPSLTHSNHLFSYIKCRSCDGSRRFPTLRFGLLLSSLLLTFKNLECPFLSASPKASLQAECFFVGWFQKFRSPKLLRFVLCLTRVSYFPPPIYKMSRI